MSKLIVLLLLSFLALSWASSCLNDCSGHGKCNGSVCQCNTNWAGEDCSISDIAAVSGQIYTGNLTTGSWQYFHISVSSATGLLVEVNQTSATGDVDLYVQKDDYPTLSYYYQKDITTRRQLSMEITSPASGMWYVGLYGYWRVSYSARITVLTGCTVPCVYGTCTGDVCTCQQYYSGSDCSLYNRPISNMELVAANIDKDTWKYFNLQVPHGSSMYINLTTTSHGDADLELFAQVNHYPTLTDFAYANVTNYSIEPWKADITVPMAAAGNWFIGVYGAPGTGNPYAVTSFTLDVVIGEAKCVSQCSKHGTCSSGVCTCQQNFSGEYCEIMTSNLQLGTPVSGYVDVNTWNYYRFNVQSENDIVLQVTQSGGDCDVYIRAGGVPDLLHFDILDWSTAQAFNVTITQPAGIDWYIGVYGWEACDYSMVLVEPAGCLCGSSSHGHCESSDICICDDGWGGVLCNIQATNLVSNVVIYNQSIQKNQWVYYTFVASSSGALFSLLETQSTGYIWLYVSMNEYPNDPSHYEYANRETNTNLHQVSVIFNSQALRTYYVGVYGNPFLISTVTQPVQYDITAWNPPFK